MTRCCAQRFGAVMPLLRPSLLTRCLDHGVDRQARGDRVVEAAQHHYGNALAAADSIGLAAERFTAPVRRRQACLGIEDVQARVSARLTPAATAWSHSPWRSACTARWAATSDEEHAVSTAMLGPSRSS